MFINPLTFARQSKFGVIPPEASCFTRVFCFLEYAVTLQEHKAILAFLDRVASTPQDPLDIEADAIIRAYFKRYPDTAYRLTKLAMAALGASSIEAEADLPRRRGWLARLGGERRA